ncbi:outer membrane protein assembly factor BamD [Spongiivirga citrea]|uniref:Outer membrane protein assembly factor BamD n=1 Tax=Spongiivirga citrea TaxID=1481457 RepID=A0A6M0CP10_9FLAO|nr:outer membrane protein assembly factor BamD [Spongiivirga citrea]NER17609.1 outer membrane protein assembly factor BamD [Spongiivirga citrea]
MFQKVAQFLFVVACFSVLVSCNEYQKALKSEDTKVKYELAQQYYDAGDFKRANRLFEQIIPKFRGKPQAERIVFFYANSYYQIKDYYTAAYQFDRFVKSHPKSEKLQEAAFLAAKSTFKLSPKYSIDQEETITAIQKLQAFINAYPSAKEIPEANDMVRQLRLKLDKKAFEIAKQYNTIRDYRSSITALDNFIVDHPGTPFKEEALYYKFDSAYRRAMNTYEYLKKTRLTEAREAYDDLKAFRPEGEFIKMADKLITDIDEELVDYQETK